MICLFHSKIFHCSIVSSLFFAMAFLGFLSINRAMKVYILFCFGVIVFKCSFSKIQQGSRQICCHFRLSACTFLHKDSAGVVYVGFVPFKFHFIFNRFRGNEVYDTGGEVCLGCESVPKVKFNNQSEELLCNVTMVLASQVSDILRFVDSSLKCTFSPELIYY